MPDQLSIDLFVNFIYAPDCLKTRTGKKTISDVPQILKETGISARQSNIILDGGNVIKSKDQVILCDKVCNENPKYTSKALIKKLEEAFEVNKVIFLPTQKNDFTGHAAGMVRFINDQTVLINQYTAVDRDYYRAILLALNNSGLRTIELPYNPYQNSSNNDANCISMNYLEMGGLIILPTFEIKEDEIALRLISQIFPYQRILTINSSDIAKRGGVLNCISWNIMI